VQCGIDSLPPVLRSYIDKKLDDIKVLTEYRLTDADITKKLERAGVMQSKAAHWERMDLQNAREAAVKAENEAEIARIDEALNALEGPKLAFAPKSRPATEQKYNQQAALTQLNARNRKLNRDEIKAAEKAERAAENARRVAPKSQFPSSQSSHLGVVFDADAAERSAAASRSGTPLPGTPKKEKGDQIKEEAKEQETADAIIKRLQLRDKKKGGIPTFSKRVMEDDVIAAMDFGVDIEMEV
jgi:RNA polymerase-associated protein RTF1